MNKQNLWSFIWHFLKPYKSAVVVFICLAMLAGCWGPFNSLLIKYDDQYSIFVSNENISMLTWPDGTFVLNFIVFDNITWRSIGYLNYKFQPVIKNQIISQTFRFVLEFFSSIFS